MWAEPLVIPQVITLRDYQEANAADLRGAFRSGFRAPLLVSPTGSGKTVLFCYIAHHAGNKGKSVLILVHRKELITQTSRTLEQFGVSHGVIAPGHSPTESHIQLASVQTLVRRLEKLQFLPDLIIVDEAHHATGKNTWGKVVSHYQERSARLIGVTATPERLDGRGLGSRNGGYFDKLILGPSVSDLIQRDYLSRPVVYAPASAPDLSGVHTRGGDYVRSELAEAVNTNRITGDAVEHYRRYSHQQPAIAFCCSIEHAETVAGRFQAAGYHAASIDGTLDDTTRRTRIDDLASGRLNVLTSCEIVSEGTDIPVLSTAILLRPTASTGMYLQQVGRALRPYPGKQRAVILDHVANCHRHGLPDDDRTWTLDQEPRRKRKDPDILAIRQCDNCYVTHRYAPVCPECGYQYPVKPREIEEVDGDLEEVSPEQIRWRQKYQQRNARTLQELEAIERARGYKRGWAKFVYAARQRKEKKEKAVSNKIDDLLLGIGNG